AYACSTLPRRRGLGSDTKPRFPVPGFFTKTCAIARHRDIRRVAPVISLGWRRRCCRSMSRLGGRRRRRSRRRPRRRRVPARLELDRLLVRRLCAVEIVEPALREAEADERVVVLRRDVDRLAEQLLRGIVLAEAERDEPRVDTRLDELWIRVDRGLERLQRL